MSSMKDRCGNITVMIELGRFAAAYSALLDIFFALYPLPMVVGLKLELRSRIMISIMLSLTALASVVSIYKLVIYDDLWNLAKVDPTYAVAYMNMLNVAEGFVLLVTASLPALAPLVRRTAAQSTSSRGTWKSSQQPSSKDSYRSTRNSSLQTNKHANSDAGSSRGESRQYSSDAIPLVITLPRKDVKDIV
ncbi:putative Integral membrane protein [Seiridium cardinale]